MRALPLLLIAACTIDLPVGTVAANEDADPDSGIHPDAAVEWEADASEPDAAAADGGRPDGGTLEPRTLQVSNIPSITCADSLGGREADFSAVRASDVDLAGGEIGYQRLVSSVILTGPAIEAAFQTARLVLSEGVVPDQPDGTLLAAVPITGGPAGPAGTELTVAAMFVDTLIDPPSGEAGFQFETPALDGACFLSFTIALLP